MAGVISCKKNFLLIDPLLVKFAHIVGVTDFSFGLRANNISKQSTIIQKSKIYFIAT